MIGTSVEYMKRAMELRRLNNGNLRRGQPGVRAATTEDQPSTVNVAGTDYPVFIPGVSDPAGTGENQTYIP